MFLLACGGAILVAALLLGGDLSRLGRLRVRRLWLPFAALGLQLLVTLTVARWIPDGVDAGLHVATYAMLGWFLWLNRRVPGLPLLGLGVISNGVTIAVNHGTLPARAAALRAAGLKVETGFSNSNVLAHPHLAWLGDVVATPSFLPLRNVMSVGDLLIMVGAAWLVLGTCGTWWSRRRPAVALPVPWSAEADGVEAPERVGVHEGTAGAVLP